MFRPSGLHVFRPTACAVSVRVRATCATSFSPREKVAEGRMREDLHGVDTPCARGQSRVPKREGEAPVSLWHVALGRRQPAWVIPGGAAAGIDRGTVTCRWQS